jgi:hypothetical protein
MSETTAEEQAAMAIKLTDNVRNLIRSEVKAALEDPTFIRTLFVSELANWLAVPIVQHAINMGLLNATIDQRVEHIVTRMRMQEAEQRRYYTSTTSGLTY